MDETPASKRSTFGDGIRRLLDERGEERMALGSQTAMLEHQGRRHVVRLVNLSPSGAMVLFEEIPHIGEVVTLQLPDRAQQAASICWVREGRIGLNFDLPTA